MNLIKRIFIIIVAIIGLVSIMPINISNASDLKTIVSNMAEKDDETTEASLNNEGTKKIKEIVKSILGALRLITGLASIIMIAYTGIKLVVGDTPEGKNSVKKAMIPIVTGTLIVFSATSIAAFIVGVFE